MSGALRRSAYEGTRFATAAKLSGAGSSSTGTRQMLAGDIDWGGIVGPIVEGVAGGIRDRIAGGRRQPTAPPPPSGLVAGGVPGTSSQDPCLPGYVRVPGIGCVKPSAALPGGEPLTMQPGGAAVMGAFGLPAMQPLVEERIVRSCGPGMVLGKDNLCYPKGVLSARSQFRKWRKAAKPPITASDMKAIRKAARARDRVKGLAKDVGFTCRTRGR